MRVLFVHFGDGAMGGSELSLLELMSSLSKRGVDARLHCNTDSVESAARRRSIIVYRGEYAPYFDYSSSAFSLNLYLGAVSNALRLLSEFTPDLVHCNSAEPSQWMRLACWLRRTPMLVQLHGRYLRRSRYVLGLHLADRIVGVSHAVVDPLHEDGVEAARLGVVYNGFDAAAVLAGSAVGLRAELGIPPNAVVGAIAGGLLRLKGHDLLFAAMRDLAPLRRPFHVLVIGEGRERAQLGELASGLPVHFLGHRADVGAVFRDAADFLIAPSRHEGFGRVIIEAALAGIPAVGARVGGIPEAIEEGSTGLLVDPESPTAIAAAITTLVSDHRLRQRMGQAAQARARDLFLIDRVADEMFAQYQATLKQRRPSLLDAFRPARIKPYARLVTGSKPAKPLLARTASRG
jgi:glycosyltransferase involved in cell wall biosynthesis